jgi:hypothetical protein
VGQKKNALLTKKKNCKKDLWKSIIVVSLYSQNDMTMTNTTTNTIIKVTEGTLTSDVFYGSFDTVSKDKTISVMVSNHIKDINKEYEFRIAGKCKAGFINIHDKKGTAHSVIAGYKKNTLVNIQVKVVYDNGVELWHNVFTTKGNKWHGIDKAFLDVLTVGDMRSSFPDMCDMNIWDRMGAKTWADKAFTQN